MGVKTNAGEALFTIYCRILNSSIWKNTKDISQWDLSTDGAKELNTLGKDATECVLLSYSGHASQAAPITGFTFAFI